MAEGPRIAQFPSAQVCGCGNRWKKKDRPLRCPNHSTNNAALKPSTSTQWGPAEQIWDLAVVDANTIAVLTVLQNGRALYLLRLGCGPAEYKLRFLHHFDDETNVALSSNVGGREVRNALFGASNTITFVRLDVTKSTLEVGNSAVVPFREGLSVELAWPSASTHTFYAREFVPNGEVAPENSPLLRFNPEKRKWDELGAIPAGMRSLDFFLVERVDVELKCEAEIADVLPISAARTSRRWFSLHVGGCWGLERSLQPSTPQ
ncbi:hypothetical protein M3Y99_01872900 [Aphelenchoides fujianensis]|nr:hypothetical protein M3Y99_01872900 [Aphelenchoides fujianensis]